MPASDLDGHRGFDRPARDTLARDTLARDTLTRERVRAPDAVQSPETASTRCPECGALHHQGRWRWGLLYIAAGQAVCPACRRVAEHRPAGLLIVSGPGIAKRGDDILLLIRREEALERQENPLSRIMDVVEHGGRLSVTTTDAHLPRRLGGALERTYRGTLDLRVAAGEPFVRVHWHAGP